MATAQANITVNVTANTEAIEDIKLLMQFASIACHLVPDTHAGVRHDLLKSFEEVGERIIKNLKIEAFD